MSGLLASMNGDSVSDCTIKDMNAGGAQIGFSRAPTVGEELYLLDVGNRVAYLVRVAWSTSDSAGLFFLKSYALGLGLPSPLKFFWRLVLESKLKEVDRAIAAGISAGLAFTTVGLAEEQLHQMARHAVGDEKFESLLGLARRRLKNGTA